MKDLTKTKGHQKLIALGYEHSKGYNTIEYYLYQLDRDDNPTNIVIHVKDKRYWLPDNESIDLRVAKILVEILEELNND